jgi:hypothetical protein
MRKKKPEINNELGIDIHDQLNATLLATLLECQLGTVKQADCAAEDATVRAVIQRIRLHGPSVLNGWLQDDEFINRNEQGPLEVFAHFFHQRKNMLIVLNGISTVNAIYQQGADIGIEIRSVNTLKR